MAFTPQFLDELRARTGLAEVVSRRVKLTRKGHEHLGLCPFHKEKTPSFTLNEEKGFYHCFGCGAHGSAFDFVMQTEGLSFPEAVERLAGDAGMEVPVDTPQERERALRNQSLYDVMEQAAAVYEKTLRMPEGRPALNYLKGRGLGDETLTRFRLGFAPDSRGFLKTALARENISEGQMIEAGLLIRPEDSGRDSYDRFRGRIMFPITDRRGRVIAFGGRILGDGEPKYLNSPETPLFHKGRTLYALSLAGKEIRAKGEAVVSEGYMDVIALHQAGFLTAVAPLGTALTEEQIMELWRIVREPVLCFDGDTAGARAAGRAAERVLPLLKPGYSLRIAELPAGDDPDTLIRRAGAEEMSRVLAKAIPLSDVLWQMETRGRMITTPEDRAALQKRLEDLTRRINDPTVRAHFLKSFKDRIWTRRNDAGSRTPGGWKR
ncbi:MAG: DNA primase, partial [Rhodospirillales bacterium]|nr:DNA primase [Rhodospirillales bacterium]